VIEDDHLPFFQRAFLRDVIRLDYGYNNVFTHPQDTMDKLSPGARNRRDTSSNHHLIDSDST